MLPGAEVIIQDIFEEALTVSYKILYWLLDWLRIFNLPNASKKYKEHIIDRYGKMKIIGMKSPVPQDNIFIPVNILCKIPALQNVSGLEIVRCLFAECKQDIFSQIAYQTFLNDKYSFKQREFLDYIANFLKNLPEASVETIKSDSEVVFRTIEAQHEIFKEQSKGIYSFSHLTIQEYFTAKYIVDHVEEEILNNLIHHLTDERWRGVFLLTAGMLTSADGLILLMKEKTDQIIDDEQIRRLLTWAKDKAASSSASYNTNAIIAFYIYLARVPTSTLVFDLDITCAHDNICICDLHLDYSFVLLLVLACGRARGGLDIHYALTLAHILGLDFNLAYDFDRIFKFALHCIDKLNLTTLKGKLIALKGKISGRNISQKIWVEFADELQKVMFTHRNLGHDFNLSQSQNNKLASYLYANKLIVDCLNAGCDITDKNRDKILKELLIPLGGTL